MAAKKSGPPTSDPEHPANELAKPDGAATTIPKASPDPWSTVVTVTSLKEQDRLKCLLYGPNGSGKTTTAARFRCPVIGLTEQQAVPAIKEANPNALIKVIRTPQDLLEFRQIFRSAQLMDRVDAVVLDSLTDVQRILKDLYTGQQAKRKDVTDVETWGRIIDATARLAREMRDLPVHTMVICLDSEIEVEGEGIIHRPAVSGKALPNQLGQFFNLVGYISRQTRPSGTRREVMFEGSERYQTKRMTGIDDVEAPEPLLWIAKRFGAEVPDTKDFNGKNIKDRLAEWQARGSMETSVQPDATINTTNTNTTNNTGTVDPFAGA